MIFILLLTALEQRFRHADLLRFSFADSKGFLHSHELILKIVLNV